VEADLPGSGLLPQPLLERGAVAASLNEPRNNVGVIRGAGDSIGVDSSGEAVRGRGVDHGCILGGAAAQGGRFRYRGEQAGETTMLEQRGAALAGLGGALLFVGGTIVAMVLLTDSPRATPTISETLAGGTEPSPSFAA
jgi:hypothetical protein